MKTFYIDFSQNGEDGVIEEILKRLGIKQGWFIIKKISIIIQKIYTQWIRTSKRPSRVFPDFIIIGAQKCGTTSLYNYLIQHPLIIPSWKKEVHFFDNNFHKGFTFYKSFFPTKIYKNILRRIYKKRVITGEASPYYIFHPHAYKRIHSLLPNIKLILLLRNPVERALSHYYHEVNNGRENLSFEQAIEKESERLRGELEKMLENENYYSFNLQNYSYVSRGIYIDMIKKWHQNFSKDLILIIKSEDFFENPSKVLKEVFEFLDLPNYNLKQYQNFNIGRYPEMDEKIRKTLREYYKPVNQRLYNYLGQHFNWDD